MKSACVFALLMGLSLPVVEVLAEIRYVKADAVGVGDGTSWADAYTDLEDALSVAVSGDQVWVAEGVYTPSVRRTTGGDPSDQPGNEVFLLGLGVELYGGFLGHEGSLEARAGSAASTVLSGEIGEPGTHDNARTVIMHLQPPPGGTDRARIDSLRITGANSAGSPRSGGGVRIVGWRSGPTTYPARIDLVQCVIDSNEAGGSGGGAYIDTWQGRIEDCVIESNHARSHGGGIELMNIFEPSEVSGTRFIGNTTSAEPARIGGGMRITSPVTSGAVRLDRCVFDSNTASGAGGGLAFIVLGSRSDYPVFEISNSRFTQNHAGGRGAGLTTGAWLPPDPDFRFDMRLTNCTIADNTTVLPYGGGLSIAGCNLIARNLLAWNNHGTKSVESIYMEATATADVTYSCIQGGFPGLGNIDADPAFSPDGSYRLTPGSPCVDAGDSTGIDPLASDLGGGVRLVNAHAPDTGLGCPVVDIGAFELADGCIADWTGDCRTNFVDIARYLSDWAETLDAADLNGDGLWTFTDLDAFITAFSSGC